MNEIKIISDNKMCEDALRRYITFVLEDCDIKSLILIDVNSVMSYSQRRTDRVGISLAKEYVKDENNIVILLGLEPESSLLKNNEHFAALMAYPNVGFVDILAMQNVLPKYQELLSGQKKKDATRLALYEFHQLEKTIAVLRHSISHIENNPSYLQKWLSDARKAGLTGSDEEIVQYVKDWRPETNGIFTGKLLEGVFVDAFETLFDQNWCLVPKVKEAVQKIADANKQPIFIISDSEQSLLESKLSNYGINWPLMSKYDIRGATLQTVIDNLSQNDFESNYGISVQRFINVSEL